MLPSSYTLSPIVAGRIDWNAIQNNIQHGEYKSSYTAVLDFGDLDDLIKVMEISGPKPEVIFTNKSILQFSSLCTVLLTLHLNNLVATFCYSSQQNFRQHIYIVDSGPRN